MEVDNELKFPGNPLLSVLCTQTEDQMDGVVLLESEGLGISDKRGRDASGVHAKQATVTAETVLVPPAATKTAPISNSKTPSLEDDDALMDEDVTLQTNLAEPDDVHADVDGDDNSGQQPVARRRLSRLKRLNITAKATSAATNAGMQQHGQEGSMQQDRLHETEDSLRKKRSRVVVKSTAVFDDEEDSLLMEGSPATKGRDEVPALI